MAETEGGGSRPNMDSLANVIISAMNTINEDEPQVEDVDMEIYNNMKRKREEEMKSQQLKVQVCNNSTLIAHSPPISLDDYVDSIDSHNREKSQNSIPKSLNETRNKSNESPTKSSYGEKCKNNYYYESDVGPFVLYVERKNANYCQAMQIGKIIRSAYNEIYRKIFCIKKIGRNRVKITLSSFKDANKLLKAPLWLENDYVCFIPSFVIFRQGVIRNVDCSLSEDEIKEDIIASQQVLQVKRIYKRDKNDVNVKKTLPVIIVAFRGQFLPSEVKILGVICRVEPYIQRVLQCYHCLRYGHISSLCKSSEPRCENCGRVHDSSKEKCNNPLSCVHCKGNHKSTDSKVCPEFKVQMIIKEYMSKNNVSYSEARGAILGTDSYASKASSPPNVSSQTLFPPLRSSLNESTRESDLPSRVNNNTQILELRNSRDSQCSFSDPSNKVRGQPHFPHWSGNGKSIGSKDRDREYNNNKDHHYQSTQEVGSWSQNSNFDPMISPAAPVYNNQKYKENVKVGQIKDLFVFFINKLNSLGIKIPLEEISSVNIEKMIKDTLDEGISIIEDKHLEIDDNDDL